MQIKLQLRTSPDHEELDTEASLRRPSCLAPSPKLPPFDLDFAGAAYRASAAGLPAGSASLACSLPAVRQQVNGPSCALLGFFFIVRASFPNFRVGAVSVGSSHGIVLRNSGKRRKARDLPLGWGIQPRTLQRRDALGIAFLGWLDAAGIDRELFEDSVGCFDIDTNNVVLAKYSRALYAGGRPYSHFCETINSFSARVPKRQATSPTRSGCRLRLEKIRADRASCSNAVAGLGRFAHA